jgi:hypothetical protein
LVTRLFSGAVRISLRFAEVLIVLVLILNLVVVRLVMVVGLVGLGFLFL